LEFDRVSGPHKPIVKRPMSAATRVSGLSNMSNIPDIGRMKVMLIANDIYRNRSNISEVL
jgi:hypothetical protein